MEALHPGAVDPSRRPGARLPLGADRGVRRRVGQQADVPLPLVLRGRPGVGGRAHRAQHEPGRRRGELLAGIRAAVKGRMVPRLAFVGSSPATKDQIEGVVPAPARDPRAPPRRPSLSLRRPAGVRRLRPLRAALRVLDRSRRPARSCAPVPRASLAWIERMLDPAADGRVRAAGRRSSRRCCRCCATRSAAVFFPWSRRQRACAGRRRRRSSPSTLDGKPFTQETQKYHAKSLAALRARYAAVADRSRARSGARARVVSDVAERLTAR